jgi:hypothetical protein
LQAETDALICGLFLVIVIVIVIIGTTVMSGLMILLCFLYSGLVVTSSITNLFRSPAVQNTVKICLPEAVVAACNGEKASRIASAFVDYGRLTLLGLVSIIWLANFTFATCTIFAAECLGAVHRSCENRTRKIVSDGHPIAEDTATNAHPAANLEA